MLKLRVCKLQKRIPFQVPDTVPWPELGKMLSTKFEAMTGRGLSDSNLRYLANKLFGTSGQMDFSNSMVTWVQFNKVGYNVYISLEMLIYFRSLK